MSVPLDIRKELWAWYYGERAFMYCQAVCEQIIKERMTGANPLYYPLNLALHVTYGRPFKRSRGIETLPEAIVPAKYLKLHQELLFRRDKMYAHTDAESRGAPTRTGIDVLYEVRSDRGRIYRGCMGLERTLKPAGMQAIVDLCSVLIEKTTYHLNKIQTKYSKELPRATGQYRIGIKPGDPEFTKVTIPSEAIS